jgi:hypothetical protein
VREEDEVLLVPSVGNASPAAGLHLTCALSSSRRGPPATESAPNSPWTSPRRWLDPGSPTSPACPPRT